MMEEFEFPKCAVFYNRTSDGLLPRREIRHAFTEVSGKRYKGLYGGNNIIQQEYPEVGGVRYSFCAFKKRMKPSCFRELHDPNWMEVKFAYVIVVEYDGYVAITRKLIPQLKDLKDFIKEVAQHHEYCYMMSNYDVLAMITAADSLEKTDKERSKKLLEEALKLDEWLIEEEPKGEMKPLHVINKMQILKRQRELTADEYQILEAMLSDEQAGNMVKAGAYLLLDRQENFRQLFETMTEEEKMSVKDFPIWRFVKEMEGE